MRICTNPEAIEARFKEIKALLVAKDYNPKLSDSAINIARAIPGHIALRNK